MARRIENSQGSTHWTSLVPLQPSGDQLPLFCMHGWGGGVFAFMHLARELGPDRPVYGLQAQGLDGTLPRHTTVEEMARHYVSEIRELQPHGPYHLAGQSLGGWVAYAVAQELGSQGEGVALLAMLDTQASSNVGWTVFLRIELPVLLKRALSHVRQAWQLPASVRWQYLQRRWKWLKLHLPGAHRVLPQERSDVFSKPDVDKGQLIDYYDALVVRYRPSVFAGDVVLFAGEDVKDFPHEKFWKNFVDGQVDFHRIAGHHHSLISKQHAPAVARLFQRLMAAEDTV